MIKTLIFDFGDVFINLDKSGALKNALDLFKMETLSEDLVAINTLYEQGLLSTEEFLEFYKTNFSYLNESEIIDAWNYILKDFPKNRLEFIKQLASEKKYKLILLSNTNELHIKWIKENVSFYEVFKSCFDQFYLSHEINFRKPNANIFEFVLNENKLNPKECLFIDDTKEHIETANNLGLFTWNIDETTEDIVDLFSIKADLF